MKHHLFALAALILATPAAAQSPSAAFADHVIQQLACLRRPNPTPTITYLVQAKLINLKAQEGYDSLSCWKLTKSLQVKGLPVVGVCAYEEDDLIKAQHPGYYWRGPGTSPGVQLMLLTSARPEAAKAWWKKVGFSENGPKIEPSSDQAGITEIRCSDYDVKG